MIAEVIVDVSNSEVDRFFDYIVPSNLATTAVVGSKVVVPFGNRFIEGFITSLKQESELEITKLKELKSVKKEFIISQELMELCFYLKENFYLKMIDCIRLCVPTVIRNEKIKHKILKTATITQDKNVINNFYETVRKNAKNQILAVEYMQAKKQENLQTLNAKFSNIAIKKLIEMRVLTITSEIVNRTPLEFEFEKQKNITLTEMQQKAISKILQSKEQTFVLHGVTGSGKTEVYLNVIENVVNKQNKTAIMLVPEISLTPQMLKRVRGRFGDSVAVLHSGLSAGEKHDEWIRIYNGEAKIVLGARSAIFAPIKNVGVIIIDEEHDNSYVSDSNPRYITEDVALFRSKFWECPLVLGSATPSIDTYYKAKQGSYKLIELPTRVNNQKMPQMQIVDMLPEFRGGNTSAFSSVLVNELEKVINTKKQAIFFINRRGFSSSVICQSCAHVPKCSACDVALTYHKFDHQLKCHFCGNKYKMLTNCPECNSESLKLGSVGTQRVVADLKKMFPDVAIFRMDNDTTTTKNAHNKILSEFEKHKPAILVGTQMIAKGHDFPLVTLVGVLDADLSLYFGEFRATEKTFQLITQVAGRAGRDIYEGKVVLQTYYPKHYVYSMAANYNYKAFYDREINLREATTFPPFSKVARVLITSPNDDFAKESTHKAFMKLKKLRQENAQDFIFLQAMRSPITKIKNKHRYQIVLRFKENKKILSSIYEICDKIRNKNITVFVEINPQSMS